MAETIYTVRLEDKYSDKAKTIASSTNAMKEAMERVKFTASSMSSAMKSAFSGTKTIKIKDVGSVETKNKIRALQKDLRATTGKDYLVKIRAQDSARQKIANVKKEMQSVYDTARSKTLSFKTNAVSLIKAKKDAKALADELTKTTGKKHKIDVELRSNGKGFFSDLKDKLRGSFSGGGGQGGGGSIFGQMLKANLVGAGISKAAGAAMSGASTVIGGGMQRLTDLQSSKARLKGFGYDKKSVNAISDNAMSSVLGTPYAFADAMTTATGLVAAGIKPGAKLEGTLNAVVNAAAASGSSLEEMGSIFNKVATSNAAQNDELRQVADRGIPIYQALGDVMGISADKVKEAAAKGEVTFDVFQKAMAKAGGTAADEMGKTFEGAKANMLGALKNLGMSILGGSSGEGGLFAGLAPAMDGLKEKFNALKEPAGRFGDMLGNIVGGALQQLPSVIDGVINVFKNVGTAIGPAFQEIANAAVPLIGPFVQLGQAVVPVVVNALGAIAPMVSAIVVPSLNFLGSVITNVAIPVLNALASFISGRVQPIFSTLASITTKVVSAFKSVASAVGSAVNALKSIPGKIAGAFSSFVGGGSTAKNATGTSYFSGGLTTINERGEEMIQLARGTKIYPAGKSEKLMKKELESSRTKSTNKYITYNPTIIINGANKSNAEVADLIDAKLRRLAVNV